MLERPSLPDDRIIACLRQEYGLAVDSVEFLPIGNDSNAWAFRVYTQGGPPHFLKVRRGAINESSLSVPRALQDQGITQVIAPLPSRSGRLWQSLGDFALILYPYIDGRLAMDAGMPDACWVELGRIVKRIHTLDLSADVLGQIKRENFSPRWFDYVRELQAHGVPKDRQRDPFGRELAAFWQEKRDEIGHLLARTGDLARALRSRPLHLVLCHADIHTANLLLDPEQRLYVIDWDETVLAPKERDLMFVVGSGIGFSVGPKEEALFFQGYGATEIDAHALAFYRYGWAIEEIGDYSARILIMPEIGDDTKQQALELLRWEFEPGAPVQSAYLADPQLRE